MDKPRILIVAGPSGCGKSTLSMQLQSAGAAVQAIDTKPILSGKHPLTLADNLILEIPTNNLARKRAARVACKQLLLTLSREATIQKVYTISVPSSTLARQYTTRLTCPPRCRALLRRLVRIARYRCGLDNARDIARWRALLAEFAIVDEVLPMGASH